LQAQRRIELDTSIQPLPPAGRELRATLGSEFKAENPARQTLDRNAYPACAHPGRGGKIIQELR